MEWVIRSLTKFVSIGVDRTTTWRVFVPWLFSCLPSSPYLNCFSPKSLSPSSEYRSCRTHDGYIDHWLGFASPHRSQHCILALRSKMSIARHSPRMYRPTTSPLSSFRSRNSQLRRLLSTGIRHCEAGKTGTRASLPARPRYVAFKPPEPIKPKGPVATTTLEAKSIPQPTPMRLNPDAQRRYETIKRTLYLSTLFLIGYYSAKYLYNHVPIELKHRSCAEWTWKESELWQEMHALREDEKQGIERWTEVLRLGQSLLDRLDDAEGVIPVEDGVGTGLEFWMQVDGENRRLPRDLREKSYEWRTGYLEALLICIEAAEKLSGKAIDTRTSQLLSNEQYMQYMGWVSAQRQAHRLGDQTTPFVFPTHLIAAGPPPKYFYDSLLTTIGLTPRQYYSAANQYAIWLEHSKSFHEAEIVYQSLLDSAIINLPPQTSHIIDPNTAIISAGAPPAVLSENLISSVTWLARFWARQGDISKALPPLISVLRARQSLPLVDTPTDKGFEMPRPPPGFFESSKRLALDILTRPPPLEEPINSSGLEPPARTQRALCEEAALMADIGEIMFASAAETEARERGMSWTIGAVELGAGVYGGMKAGRDRPTMEFCRGCILGGLRNWGRMFKELDRATNERLAAANWLQDAAAGGKAEDESLRVVARPRFEWKDLLWTRREKEEPRLMPNGLIEMYLRRSRESRRYEDRRAAIDSILAKDVLRWHQEDTKGVQSWGEWLMQ